MRAIALGCITMIDPRTPVIVGVGQFLHRAAGVEDAMEPAALMEAAIVEAASDAGLDGPPAVDSIRVVSSLSWRYGNPAWIIAQRLGQQPRELAYTGGRRQHAADARQPHVARHPAPATSTRRSSSAARRGGRGCAPARRAQRSSGPRHPTTSRP